MYAFPHVGILSSTGIEVIIGELPPSGAQIMHCSSVDSHRLWILITLLTKVCWICDRDNHPYHKSDLLHDMMQQLISDQACIFCFLWVPKSTATVICGTLLFTLGDCLHPFAIVKFSFYFSAGCFYLLCSLDASERVDYPRYRDDGKSFHL